MKTYRVLAVEMDGELIGAIETGLSKSAADEFAEDWNYFDPFIEDDNPIIACRFVVEVEN